MDEVTIRVVRGEPTPEELAALVTALVSRTAAPGAGVAEEPTSRWAASARPRPRGIGGFRGPGAWRASALP